MKGISVMIPIYNEADILEKNVARLFAFMTRMRVPFEIILCDNGSTDQTPNKARKLSYKYHNVKYARIDKRGVGLAFAEGVKKAKFNKTVSLDADLSTDLNFIKESCELLERYAVVIGSKKIGLTQRPSLRKFASEIFVFITNFSLNLKFTDYSPNAKAFRRNKILDFLEYLESDSFYTTQLLYYCKKNNFPIIEIPILCVDTRSSKFNIYTESIHRLLKLLGFSFVERIFKKTNSTPIPVRK